MSDAGPIEPAAPGALDWKPALEHLELMAAPTAAALAAELAADGIECLVAPIDARLADTAEFCAAYGVELAESANCVVVEGRRGETVKMAACMLLATDRADVNRIVRKHLDVRKISFASMESATHQTGMEYGGITPVGLPDNWPILVDRRAAEAGWVVIGGGVRGAKLAVRGADLARLPGAEVIELALG